MKPSTPPTDDAIAARLRAYAGRLDDVSRVETSSAEFITAEPPRPRRLVFAMVSAAAVVLLIAAVVALAGRGPGRQSTDPAAGDDSASATSVDDSDLRVHFETDSPDGVHVVGNAVAVVRPADLPCSTDRPCTSVTEVGIELTLTGAVDAHYFGLDPGTADPLAIAEFVSEGVPTSTQAVPHAALLRTSAGVARVAFQGANEDQSLEPTNGWVAFASASPLTGTARAYDADGNFIGQVTIN